jgi:hypothetical protein
VGEGERGRVGEWEKDFSFAILDLSFVIEEMPIGSTSSMTNDKSKIANEKSFSPSPPLPLSHSPTLVLMPSCLFSPDFLFCLAKCW